MLTCCYDIHCTVAHYRREAVRWHPDKNAGDKGAEERFKHISEAYDTLKDRNKRFDYDSKLRRGWTGPEAPGARQQPGWQQGPGARGSTAGGYYTSPGAGFRGSTNFGGFGFGTQQPQQPVQFPKPPKWRTLRMTLECTLEELFAGAVREVQFKRGTWERYVQAGKTGLWMDVAAQALLVALPTLVRLPVALSAIFFGGVFHKMMPELPSEVFRVTIPPGCGDGAQIRLGQDPEIFIEVVELPHKLFERRGNDLLIRRRLTARKMAQGGDFSVPTLERGTAIVHLRKGEARDGYIKAVPGLGMPARDGSRGRLLVMFIT
eukprot:TRINITY_DN2319_c0_g1_i3.p1 TRINITY_DN2319_c0_g1~~TRINITY_DN2319_c0_g1_i3.p1  ORF type:complete len:319 (-),score=55.75 TRINITY_DN2319_c0_g1_i3:159-1115(-)